MPSISKPSPAPTAFTTKLVNFSSKLKFPKAARRYTHAQLQQIRDSDYLMPTILVDKCGLVIANFAGAIKANKSVFGTEMLIVHESDLTQAQARKLTHSLKGLAKKNKWDRDILDIELQYLRKLI